MKIRIQLQHTLLLLQMQQPKHYGQHCIAQTAGPMALKIKAFSILDAYLWTVTFVWTEMDIYVQSYGNLKMYVQLKHTIPLI